MLFMMTWSSAMPAWESTLKETEMQNVLAYVTSTFMTSRRAEPKPATKPAAKTSQAAPRPTGRVLQTPAGPGVVSIGTDGKETILLPNGQKGTVSPAGSGTAMVKLPDGRSYTVADPR